MPLKTLLIKSAVVMLCSPIFCSMASNTVIHISIDGLRGDALSAHSETVLPNFHKIISISNGYTLNATTDFASTRTLANHVSMITGMTVSQHQWTINEYESTSPITVHNNTGSNIVSVFGKVKEAGYSTALFATKDKFALFKNSWPSDIDEFQINQLEVTSLVSAFNDHLSNKPAYAFLHIRLPDSAGHEFSWGSNEYFLAVEQSDVLIGSVINAVEQHGMSEQTAYIVTADHGGTNGNIEHDTQTNQDRTIPFILACPNIDNFNVPDGTANSESSNLALKMLGLNTIPGAANNLPLRGCFKNNLSWLPAIYYLLQDDW